MDMRAHSQTIDQRPQVNIKVDIAGLDWFQRLRLWFRGFSRHSPGNEPLSLYGTWDPKREQFHQLQADAAADLIAARNGVSWATKIFSVSI
jgi:hypothetical protein